MSAQSVGVGSMFGWITGAFRIIGGNFAGLMLASLVSLGVVLLMILPMFILMAVFMPAAMASAGTGDALSYSALVPLFIAYALMLVLFLFLFPPLMTGWFRVCQAADRGAPIRALDVLRPYADRQVWLCGIRFALLAVLVYFAVFVVFGLAFSGDFSAMMQQAAAQQAASLSGVPAPAAEAPGIGFLAAYFFVLVLSLFLQLAYMVGFVEISLRQTTAWQALKLAGVGTARNALKLLLFFLCTTVLALVVLFGVVLVLVVVIGALTLVSQGLSIAVGVVLYIALALLMYPLMFAGHYLAWKSMLGGDEPAGSADHYEEGALAV